MEGIAALAGDQLGEILGVGFHVHHRFPLPAPIILLPREKEMRQAVNL
jgi:hypothetical protein